MMHSRLETLPKTFPTCNIVQAESKRVYTIACNVVIQRSYFVYVFDEERARTAMQSTKTESLDKRCRFL